MKKREFLVMITFPTACLTACLFMWSIFYDTILLNLQMIQADQNFMTLIRVNLVLLYPNILQSTSYFPILFDSFNFEFAIKWWAEVENTNVWLTGAWYGAIIFNVTYCLLSINMQHIYSYYYLCQHLSSYKHSVKYSLINRYLWTKYRNHKTFI